jgi:O-antigen ligase
VNNRQWRLQAALTVVVPLGAVAGTASAAGGYFPTSFGWTTLCFALVVTAALLTSSPTWSRLDGTWFAIACGLCVLTFVSSAWAGSVDGSVDAGLRMVVYVTGIGVGLLVLRRGNLSWWLAGVVFGAAGVCVYSLATHLFPARFGGLNAATDRLFVPVGYWNALGIFAAMALLLGFGVTLLGRWRVLQVGSAVATIALAPTLYFTFSRGAWIAMGIGCAAMIAIAPDRIRLTCSLLVLAVLPSIAVFLSWRSPALTHEATTLVAATDAGRKLALQLAILALAQAFLATGYVSASHRLQIPHYAARVVVALLAAGAVAAVAVVSAMHGGPGSVARRAYDKFASAPTSPNNLNSRLFSLSNDGRLVLWHAAWKQFEANPIFGGGAGSFAQWWLAHRVDPFYVVQDAHNLYLQTLAELGIVGLVLLVALLLVPLVAAVRARRYPLVAPAFGAYVAYVFHASVDWDWQMPAVTLVALFTGAAILAAARGDSPSPAPMRLASKLSVGAATLVFASFAFVALIGNIALSRADLAIQQDDADRATSAAKTAVRWEPWSAQALEDLGDARLLRGERTSGLTTLDEAAAKDPQNWRIWFDIAAATSGVRHREALARAKALNPHGLEIMEVESSAH